MAFSWTCPVGGGCEVDVDVGGGITVDVGGGITIDVGVGVAVATQLLQTADVMHGCSGTSQISVVDVETQELPDSVEIGSTVVMVGVDENVSVGNGGEEDEIVKGGDIVEEGIGEGDTVEDGNIVEEGIGEGDTVEEGNIVEEIEDEVPEFPGVAEVWLALPETDTEVNVIVGAIN
ncbi:uncharacterized protein PAC_09297 [Phialocephala subalpina]|uniref:Uncharacterized protein n=1 Tax=Phialocephala subalpina TaxID=576137 RepID=A0A1L7X2X6_9HELO|nr:uncharacterized protein PAC_09297 [Phialocephala subalpina]